MTVPSPDEITAKIAELADIDAGTVADVLAGHGVSLIPVPPAKRQLDIRRLSFSGEKAHTQWDGPFEKVFEFGDGVTALITDQNLRGKSTVLELIAWALRGSPRDELRADVRPWFNRIALEYAVNGTAMAVVLTKEESGFLADILRADSPALLRRFVDGLGNIEDVHVVASKLSAPDFGQQQVQFMMSLLSLEPMSNFQKYQGSDQGHPVSQTWPAYFGGLYLPKADSELLFGETAFAALPARILQMYCNVPLMGAHIRLTTLSRQVSQDEANRGRRVAEDAAGRAGRRAELVAQLKAVEQKLGALPTARGRSFDVITIELRAAEKELDTVSASARVASRTFDDVKAARQAEELLANNLRENELALALFQGIQPKRCPRCEQRIEDDRAELELSDHHCAVCTREIPVRSNDTGDQGEPEVTGDGLAALTAAETAARETANAAADEMMAARDKVDSLAAELSAASQAKEYSDRVDLQIERARLQGSIEALPEVGMELEPTESLRVIEAATKVLKTVTGEAAAALFEDLNAEVVLLGQKFGIENLEAVKLDRSGRMMVTTAGEETPFKRLSGGERLRLRIAVVVALLRVGHRAGVGSHPGLILLDSPGSDELTVDDEATLLRELDSLKTELPGLQVVISSAEPSAVLNHLSDSSIYASLDGSPLW